jgi:acetyltransferase-like isoleucine patch superfamily enzyme
VTPTGVARIARLRRAGSRVSLRGVRLDRASTVEPGAALAHHVELLETTVGRYASIGRYTKCHFADIGAFDSIAWDSTIGATGHPLDRGTTHAFPYRRSLGIVDRDASMPRPRVRLGPDVWVGTHVVILPGVEIGAGAVIGAGSVVTSSVPPYAVVLGSPARVSRFRADETTVERLLAIGWWRWDLEALQRAAPLLAEPIDGRVLEDLEEIATSLSSGDAG